MVACNNHISADGYIYTLRKWQNNGPFVWQQEEIHLIFANRSTLDIEHLQ